MSTPFFPLLLHFLHRSTKYLLITSSMPVCTSFVVYDRHHSDTLTARCDPESHLVLVGNYLDNKPMPVIGVPGNYHHRELKFYYPYICQNIMDRVAAFLQRFKHPLDDD